MESRERGTRKLVDNNRRHHVFHRRNIPVFGRDLLTQDFDFLERLYKLEASIAFFIVSLCEDPVGAINSLC